MTLTPARTRRGSTHAIGSPKFDPDPLLTLNATPWLVTLNAVTNRPTVAALPALNVFSTRTSAVLVAASSRDPIGSTRRTLNCVSGPKNTVLAQGLPLV